ncbi:hypothetical protein QB910_000008 [Dabrowskivirus KKP3916]|uniref:Uncharacterized protein n=1 Tax=Alicyclobacillus phage KKP_3916 TaxID=3040651 RepID=A0AAT9V8N6_9CAUD|nr:hypothetical protein QB910_000008 [Alicyclobacillus phage KKP 3916]
MNDKSQLTVTSDEIVEFLETVIHDSNATDAVENLYIEYQRYGKKVFRQDKNRPLIHRIVRAIKKEYGVEG